MHDKYASDWPPEPVRTDDLLTKAFQKMAWAGRWALDLLECLVRVSCPRASLGVGLRGSEIGALLAE